MTAYYNEIDPYCAQWLRNLIAAGHIAPGIVDERSIEDVTPEELLQYTQCHFFAGIGVWSLALRSAGWPDDRRVWTGSCPCQPFSSAGKGNGFTDERHLWPSWFDLIAQCRPPVVFGEQVASKAVDAWIDLVHADMEGMGYAFGGIAFPSAGVGAPHIRDRNYWVADADHEGLEGWGSLRERAAECLAGAGGMAGRLANAARSGRRGEHADCGRSRFGDSAQGIAAGLEHGGECRGMADAEHDGCDRPQGAAPVTHRDESNERIPNGDCAAGSERPGPTNGFWRPADWLGCTDGKWRPVEPSTFPLVDGASGRVGRLRAYGNAINAEAAAEFIRAAY